MIRDAAPVGREIEIAHPLAAVRALAHLPAPFLLHAGTHDTRARWSFFGADPFALFAGGDYDRAVALWRGLRAERVPEPPGAPPFRGGVVGYWAYDFGRRLERWPSRAADDLGLPDTRLGF